MIPKISDRLINMNRVDFYNDEDDDDYYRVAKDYDNDYENQDDEQGDDGDDYYRVAESSNGLTIWQLHLQHWLFLNLMIKMIVMFMMMMIMMVMTMVMMMVVMMMMMKRPPPRQGQIKTGVA